MQSQNEKIDFSKNEEEILDFWEKNKIFEKSIGQRKGKKKFVFYEGPPYANGRPGIHHVEARAFKDIILRYKTMAGFFVPRKAGWDTHGLPTEIEVEKKLGIETKKDIEEKIGIEKFVEEAKENIFLYEGEWEKLTKRMAYWLDLKNAYVTMKNKYIETLWWIFKEIEKRKLLYEDYKILPWCPRCGTALSSHEVSQGYKKIKEESIYVKFPVKGKPNTYFLVWTTTPWTLPSNVALAINPKIDYVIIDRNGEKLILAKNRLSVVEGGYKIDEEKKGKDLVGMEYEPLYPDNAPYKVYAADFVSSDDGTGIVHIAPAFGEDDMKLGKTEKLPVLVLVDEAGKILKPGYKWNGMFIKDADSLIVEGLRQRNLLFNTESYEHDYPFCWRCKGPLMYFAKTSWWLKTTAVKKKMIEENKKINWYPDYLKKGRFGEWLNELRDWAISRERYWGTPLPIWRCEKCEKIKVIGSIEELKKETIKSGNKYFVMRHGFAENNSKDIINSNIKNNGLHLTPKGKKDVLNSSKQLKNKKIDIIFSSDFTRTKETAEMVAGAIGIPKEKIVFDERLREVNMGDFEGKTSKDYHDHFSSYEEMFSKRTPNGENLVDLKKRITQFIYEIEGKYQDKNILIVSHEYPIWMLLSGAYGLTSEESIEERGTKEDVIKNAEIKKLDFIPLPHDKNFVLDLHRPYIDKILFKCSCGNTTKRIKDVADVWFDSGSMPFAQNHYPFESAKNLPYPADYICEGMDQTRGWFYTLLAVAALIGKGSPYRNVLSLGLVLDAESQKMSKSRGNTILPIDLINKYGSDAVRWYFYTINQPWDEKSFKEEDVASVLRRFVMILWNSFVYFKTYSNSKGSMSKISKPKLIINKWLIAKFNQVSLDVSRSLDNYDIVSAARILENFVVEDISHWYIRRIREIMKNPKSKDAKETSTVFGNVLLGTAKMLAPFMPFISEKIYQEIGGKKKSVHLENLEKAKIVITKDGQILDIMKFARGIVAMALEARAKAGIKVRQPLQKLFIKHKAKEPLYWKEVKNLIADEVNVKEVVFDKTMGQDDPPVKLDTLITEELRNEGNLREVMRQMQDIRKKGGLMPNQIVDFFVATDEKGKIFMIKFAKEIKKSVNAKSLIIRAQIENGNKVEAGDLNFTIGIGK